MRNCWSLKLSEVGALFLLLSLQAQAQYSEPKDSLRAKAPASAYLFPIEPGKTAMLTGTMGELRNTHFHGGLDINTHGTGYSVYSANDGYISRATCSTSGYGNALYVTHPDGNTTLYAHLNEFLGDAGTYVRQQRYSRKQSEVDLFFEPLQFPVKKGDVIALSGNTGSSGGPHLHFELRTSQNHALNPLTVGFAEVVDHVSPMVQKVALKTLTPQSRINDQFGRFEFYVQKTGKNFQLPQPILTSGRIGVEILGYDQQENSRFKFGINHIEVWSGDQKLFVQTIDQINFSENRAIQILMDYRTLELKGARYNKLYVEDGNTLPYYDKAVEKRGWLIRKELTPIEIRLSDFYGNTSTVTLTLKNSPVTQQAFFMEPIAKPITAELFENILKVSVQRCGTTTDSALSVFTKGTKSMLPPSYSNRQGMVYLVDVKKSLPDSLRFCSSSWISNWVARVPSTTEYTFYSDQVEVEFPKGALYDTLLFRLQYDTTRGNEALRLGSELIPLHKPINVSFMPHESYRPSRNSAIYRKTGNGFAYLGNTWKNGRLQFSTLYFGDFVIKQDTVPPTIQPVSINTSVARLRIRDNLSGISYFEANINGQWLLMNYDYKTGSLFSERLDKTVPLKGDFELKVVDNAGNETLFKQKIQ